MLIRIVAVLLCLSGITDLCLADGFVPGRKYFVKNTYTPRPVKTKSLKELPFEVEAEQLKILMTQDDQCIVSLKGNARLFCGQTRYSADQIEISYKSPNDQWILMQGHVEIENEQDQLRMTAQRAILEKGRRYLRLLSRQGEQVTLSMTQGTQTTRIRADHINLMYKNLDALLIHPTDHVTLKVLPATPADRLEVTDGQPNPFDFFSGIELAVVKIYSEDWVVAARKP
ncbi:hypothetical protein Enr10x_08840 [Gimesia panareensis]|uniref:Uncharacterized protein n=1 Tax=Gimesia panareensis TaxID=2527978 RepID=A0A517Q1U2_9PLAN|nr:hypothetical protein [Gimesia panareensis]QDT25587.1 hypothetical protein Enr10x_08840 [Gimesia panareensis]